ncbi:hypothetical protein HYT55_01675 [Candidatus Woesearchaeota archaeon]|nr:hypothetical protein [Candidatus Woesearchaeota archaeon]
MILKNTDGYALDYGVLKQLVQSPRQWPVYTVVGNAEDWLEQLSPDKVRSLRPVFPQAFVYLSYLDPSRGTAVIGEVNPHSFRLVYSGLERMAAQVEREHTFSRRGK